MPVLKQQGDSNASADSRQPSEVRPNSVIDVNTCIRRHDADCVFTDCLYIPHVNLQTDQLPVEITRQLIGQLPGNTINQQFIAGKLSRQWHQAEIKTIRSAQFSPPPQNTLRQQACVGRYYPLAYFNDLNITAEDPQQHCRILDIDNEKMRIDLNHPLAKKPLMMAVKILSIHSPASNHSRPVKDISALACDHGPGLQDSPIQSHEDFYHPQAFKRINEDDDALHFDNPDLSPFWDDTALAQVTRFYQQLLQPRMRILDLMAGPHSPLQESSLQHLQVSCAGLHERELLHNPLCNDYKTVNVNTVEKLPYPTEQFDAVLIHAAIEYVTRPDILIAEVARILKVGGRIMISFSNRSVDEKVIQLWQELEEFERPRLVLDYLRRSNRLSSFQCHSQRGYLRPQNDRLAGQLQYSDPVYMVSAVRR